MRVDMFVGSLILSMAVHVASAVPNRDLSDEHDVLMSGSEKAVDYSSAQRRHTADATGSARTELIHDNYTDNYNHSKFAKHGYPVAKLDFATVSTPFIISAWIIFASIAKIGFHVKNFLSSIFPESCLLIVIGVCVGGILYASGKSDYHLDSHTFFFVLLPPIILDAGYFMPTRAFFDNIGTILLFAVVGTIWNALAIGLTLWGLGLMGVFVLYSPLHLLVFASIMAAVDPVAVLAVFEQVHVKELLHIIVLGESLLNDGIAIVLYRMFEGFSEIGIENISYSDLFACLASFLLIIVGSPLIGIAFGFAGGLMSRMTYNVRVIEPIIVFIFGYMSFLTSEMFHLSGILSCISSSITMKRYVEANMSKKSHTTVKYFMKMLSSVCDSIVFMYLGISVVTDSHHWNTAFTMATLISCLVFRSVGVVVLSLWANHRRVVKLDFVDQFIMSYGGLRGAIAFALVILLHKDVFPQRDMFITTAVFVIYFTNLILGTTIKPLVKFLKVKRNMKTKPSMSEQVNARFLDYVMAGVEDITGLAGHHCLRERFISINNKYIKPLLIRKQNRHRHRGWSLVDVCMQLNERDTRNLLVASSSAGSINETALSTNGSLARIFSNSSLRYYLGTSTWRRTSSDSGLHQVPSSVGIPEVGSSTCLDLQALDVQETRKMKDDSKIHHIVDDFLCRSRKKICHRRYINCSPTENSNQHDHSNHIPDHHNAPVHLRHVLSHTQWMQSTAARSNAPVNGIHVASSTSVLPDGSLAQTGINGGHAVLKPNKTVSFATMKNVLDDNGDEGSNAIVCDTVKIESDDEDDDDNGIVFTVPVAVLKDDCDASSQEDVVQTAVELSLPWKRNTCREPMSSVKTHTMPDDSCPELSEVCSWVIGSNADQHSSDHYDDDDDDDVNDDDVGENVKRRSSIKSVSSETNSVGSTPLATDANILPSESALLEDTICNRSIPIQMRKHSFNFVGSNGFHSAYLTSDDPIPPPWRTFKLNSESQLNHAVCLDSLDCVSDHAAAVVDKEEGVEVDVAPLPWRTPSSNERPIPDQHAPRPAALPMAYTSDPADGVCCSPTHSFVDGISMNPQASCQSFRLSEAESRHSEPFHQHHVIDMTSTSASHWIPPSLASNCDLASAEILSNLEQIDNHQRIFQWLDTLAEYSEGILPDLVETNETGDT